MPFLRGSGPVSPLRRSPCSPWRPCVSPSPDPFPLRVEVSNPTNAPTGPAALSPDGQTLVYVGRTGPTGPERMLFVRRLDQLVSRAIPGTEGAGFRSIWWSPDGRWIGFVANRRKLMKVSLEGGAPVALADVADEGGGGWTRVATSSSVPASLKDCRDCFASTSPEGPFNRSRRSIPRARN